MKAQVVSSFSFAGERVAVIQVHIRAGMLLVKLAPG